MGSDTDFRADLEKLYRIESGGRPLTARRRLKLWTTHFGLHCVAAYRLWRWVRAMRARGGLHACLGWLALPVSETLCFLAKLVHHVDIFSASIGPGLYIGHAGTIFIGPTRIGANFSVTHNVTIGMGASTGTSGLPVLGRDVWVGAGSILYGGIDVGDGTVINGGTVLSRSVPERCLVGGNPGRVILRNYDNARLFGLPETGTPEPSAPSAALETALEPAAPEAALEPAAPEEAREAETALAHTAILRQWNPSA